MSYQPGVYKQQGGNKLVIVADKGFLQFGDTESNAILGGGGTNASPCSSSTAKNFLDFRTKNTAASGDLRGLYWRHELSGGASGEAGRFVGYVSATSGPDSAHGLHSTVSIAAAGKITGLAAGLRATLELADAANPGGTLCSLYIDSNVGAGATLPSRTALIRLGKAGSVDVDTFLDISDDQCLKGSAASGAASDALKVLLPDGTVRYISLVAAS